MTKTLFHTGMRRKEARGSSEWVVILVMEWCLQTGAAPPFCCLSRESSKRKKEASKIPEWRDRCYVIRAASSPPQEARSQGERRSPAAGATEQSLLTKARSWASKKSPLFLVSS